MIKKRDATVQRISSSLYASGRLLPAFLLFSALVTVDGFAAGKSKSSVKKITVSGAAKSASSTDLFNSFSSGDDIYQQDSSNSAGVTSLMSAVSSNDVDGVRFFAKSNRDNINQKNIGGATALHIACRSANVEIVKTLLENGANVNATDNEGWTSLMRAALSGNVEVVDLLLSKGANAGAINLFSESAITHATMSDCLLCLDAMFSKYDFTHMMDMSVLTDQLNAAFTIARNRENVETQKILEAYLDKIVKGNVSAPAEAVQAEINLQASAPSSKGIPIVETPSVFEVAVDPTAKKPSGNSKQLRVVGGKKFVIKSEEQNPQDIIKAQEVAKTSAMESNAKPVKSSFAQISKTALPSSKKLSKFLFKKGQDSIKQEEKTQEVAPVNYLSGKKSNVKNSNENIESTSEPRIISIPASDIIAIKRKFALITSVDDSNSVKITDKSQDKIKRDIAAEALEAEKKIAEEIAKEDAENATKVVPSNKLNKKKSAGRFTLVSQQPSNQRPVANAVKGSRRDIKAEALEAEKKIAEEIAKEDAAKAAQEEANLPSQGESDSQSQEELNLPSQGEVDVKPQLTKVPEVELLSNCNFDSALTKKLGNKASELKCGAEVKDYDVLTKNTINAMVENSNWKTKEKPTHYIDNQGSIVINFERREFFGEEELMKLHKKRSGKSVKNLVKKSKVVTKSAIQSSTPVNLAKPVVPSAPVPAQPAVPQAAVVEPQKLVAAPLSAQADVPVVAVPSKPIANTTSAQPAVPSAAPTKSVASASSNQAVPAK